jgi:hypothetical protein
VLEEWTCDELEESLLEQSVDLSGAPEPLRRHLAACASCTDRLERIRHSEQALRAALGAVRSRRQADQLARTVLSVSRSARGRWSVPESRRVAAISASVSTIGAVAAGLVLHLLLVPPAQAAVRRERHQPTVVVAANSVVLVQDDRVVAVLTSRR